MRQLDLLAETKKRDLALGLLEKHRGSLVEIARLVATAIAREKGRVTSTDVFSRLREIGYEEQIASVDPRWMGAVFRPTGDWERIGFENLGSHRRPVSVWRLKSA